MANSSRRAPQSGRTDPYVDMVTKAVLKTGRSIAVRLIAKRFAESGIKLSLAEKKAFDTYLSGGGKCPTIKRRRLRPGVSNVVTLSAADTHELNTRLKKLLKKGAAMVPWMAEDLATHGLEDFKRSWVRQESRQQRDLEGFQKRLLERWGVSLSRLSLLITLARGFGERVGLAISVPDAKSPHLVFVMTRLHARACQIGFEVYTLLASGLADGAMARCRTLHEIAATMFFLAEHGEEVAERYVLHEAIETWRAACTYNAHATRLRVRPFTKSEMQGFESVRQALLTRFGKAFDGHYGWASNVLKPNREPVRSVADIEEMVFPHLRPYYQLASHNVHAKAKGIFHRLGMIGDQEVLLAGASNAGLADPGQNAALFLSQICASLGGLDPSVETIAMMKLFKKLNEEVGDAFITAHRKLLTPPPGHPSARKQKPKKAAKKG